MKKVWVLERFQTADDMLHTLVDYNEMAESIRESGNEVLTKKALEMVKAFERRMEDNPNGYWLGVEGKSNYKAFSEVAKENLRYSSSKGKKFRVIEGEIEDSATTWVGYSVVKENEGVLRYLMATK